MCQERSYLRQERSLVRLFWTTTIIQPSLISLSVKNVDFCEQGRILALGYLPTLLWRQHLKLGILVIYHLYLTVVGPKVFNQRSWFLNRPGSDWIVYRCWNCWLPWRPQKQRYKEKKLLLKVVTPGCDTWNYNSHFAIIRTASLKMIQERHNGDMEGIWILGCCGLLN